MEADHTLALSSNVEVMPQHNFRKPVVKLAASTPGPRVEKVKNISTSRSPSDSLKIINHLQLSDDDARYIRGISLVDLATEYSVRKMKRETSLYTIVFGLDLTLTFGSGFQFWVLFVDWERGGG